MKLFRLLLLCVIALWLGPLVTLPGALGDTASAAEGCPDVRTLLQRRVAQQRMPDDWPTWWARVADGSRLETAVTLESETDTVHALFISCLARQTDLRAEGSRQWVVLVRQTPDTVQAEEVIPIGRFYCCGGAWIYHPSAEAVDLNEDGRPELRLSGRYEHGSDGHQLEGEVELYVFFGAGSEAPAWHGCWYPPPGFSVRANVLPVIKQGTYKYFGVPRLDVAPINRVRSEVAATDPTHAEAAGKAILWRQTWSVPGHPDEIQRWYESGDFRDLTQFKENTRTRQVIWNAHHSRLETVCPDGPKSFEISQIRSTELIVRQEGWDVWSLYFDELVLHIERHPAYPLAAVFTTLDSMAVQAARPRYTHAVYLVNLWTGEQIWMPIQALASEAWFFSVWSPAGSYALFPEADSDDLLLFRSAELLDDEGLLSYNWYDRPMRRLSVYDAPEAPEAAGALYFRRWLSDDRLECAVVADDTEWRYEYSIPTRQWRLIAKTTRR